MTYILAYVIAGLISFGVGFAIGRRVRYLEWEKVDAELERWVAERDDFNRRRQEARKRFDPKRDGGPRFRAPDEPPVESATATDMPGDEPRGGYPI